MLLRSRARRSIRSHLISKRGKLRPSQGCSVQSLSGLSVTRTSPVSVNPSLWLLPIISSPSSRPKVEVARGHPRGEHTCPPEQGGGSRGRCRREGPLYTPRPVRVSTCTHEMAGSALSPPSFAEGPGSTLLNWPKTQASSLNQAAQPFGHFEGLSESEQFLRPLPLSKTRQSSMPPTPRLTKHSRAQPVNKSTNTRQGHPKLPWSEASPHTQATALQLPKPSSDPF